MQEVFAAKVELDAVLQPGGFGGVKMTGAALPHCPFSVERAYLGSGPSTTASTVASSTAPTTAPKGLRAFDLRASCIRALTTSKMTPFRVGSVA